MALLSRLSRSDLRRPSVLVLVLSNLIPLAGVILLNWDIGFLILIYWAETVIIGLFNLPKLLSAQKRPKGRDALLDEKYALGCGNVFLAGFFTVHFGGFNLVHFIFLQEFFDLPSLETGVKIALGGLVLSHGFSFVVNWIGRREYLRATPNEQMFKPYGRIVVMHVTIIFGAMLLEQGSGAVGPLILLIVLKTAVDVVAHLVSHREKSAA